METNSSSEQHYVYFITMDKKGKTPIKIGRSRDPYARLKTLQTACPDKLKIIGSFVLDDYEDAKKLERALHRLASKKFKRLNGEWFVLYGGLKHLIDQALKMAKISTTSSYEKNSHPV